MCKISDYPGLYSKVSELFRREGIDQSMPGYEFLRRAVIIYKIDNEKDILKICNKIEMQGITIPCNKCLIKERNPIEQHMVEALKRAEIDISVESFIKQISEVLN